MTNYIILILFSFIIFWLFWWIICLYVFKRSNNSLMSRTSQPASQEPPLRPRLHHYSQAMQSSLALKKQTSAMSRRYGHGRANFNEALKLSADWFDITHTIWDNVFDWSCTDLLTNQRIRYKSSCSEAFKISTTSKMKWPHSKELFGGRGYNIYQNRCAWHQTIGNWGQETQNSRPF